MQLTRSPNPQYQLEAYPEELRPYIDILWNHEEKLSDGFHYYCSSIYREVMTSLATEMRDAHKQLSQVKALVRIAHIFYEKVRHISDDPQWLIEGQDLEDLHAALIPYQTLLDKQTTEEPEHD